MAVEAVLHMCENSTPHVEGRKGRKEEGRRGGGVGRKREERGGEDRKTFIQLWWKC